MKSEVELHKQLVRAGVELAFFGEEWVDYYTVVMTNETGFIVINSEGEEFAHEFSKLQLGWEFRNIDTDGINFSNFK